MDLGLQGKTALVLASTSGLGLACAQALVAEGARVVINGRRPETAAAALAALGQTAHFVRADLADDRQRPALYCAAREHLGPISILVTNGEGPSAEPFLETTLDDWQAAFRSMVVPAVDLAKRCVPDMVQSGWGRVINLGSISGKEVSLLGARANGLRPALVGAFGTLARELGPTGITVNSILSGPFDTAAMRKVVRQHSGRMDLCEEEAVAAYAASGPMGRVGRPAELGALCAFLASEHASYLTGQAIVVDGGRVPTLY